MDAILYKYRAGLWLKKGKVRRYKEDLAKAQELSHLSDNVTLQIVKISLITIDNSQIFGNPWR
jgi:hypothetical protein